MRKIIAFIIAAFAAYATNNILACPYVITQNNIFVKFIRNNGFYSLCCPSNNTQKLYNEDGQNITIPIDEYILINANNITNKLQGNSRNINITLRDDDIYKKLVTGYYGCNNMIYNIIYRGPTECHKVKYEVSCSTSVLYDTSNIIGVVNIQPRAVCYNSTNSRVIAASHTVTNTNENTKKYNLKINSNNTNFCIVSVDLYRNGIRTDRNDYIVEL